MPGTGIETGGQIWDPAGFATYSDQSLIWFRACELKHGRVAMLASAGWMANNKILEEIIWTTQTFT